MAPACIDLVVAARPNFMKADPLRRALVAEGLTVRVVHTGQHYDHALSQVFFEQLQIPAPDHHLGVGSGPQGAQTAGVLERYEALLLESPPAMTVAIGDVNSTVAVALAAVKLHLPVAHLEAGLRSFDRRMPEEVNRVLTDHMSALHLVTEQAGVDNLANEGIAGPGVHLVGNTMIDTVLRLRPSFVRSEHAAGTYAVVTLHRPGNVDSAEGLDALFALLTRAAKRQPLLLPLHPRTRASLETHGRFEQWQNLAGLTLLEPQGYLEFLGLVEGARMVLTDSGGLQAECAALGVPCITLRDSTEHRVTVESGANRLTGLDPERLREALDEVLANTERSAVQVALWDGRAAERSARAIAQAAFA